MFQVKSTCCHFLTTTFTLCALILSTGCAVSYPECSIKVQADTSPEADGLTRYYLSPLWPDEVDQQDTDYRQYAAQINTAMEEQGFISTSESGDAEMLLLFGYVRSDRKDEERSREVSIYENRLAGSETVTKYDKKKDRYISTTTNKYEEVVTGYRSENYIYSWYIYTLSLMAYSMKEGTGQPALWNVFAYYTGESIDPEVLFPYLLAAAKAYVRTNSGGTVSVKVSAADLSVTAE